MRATSRACRMPGVAALVALVILPLTAALVSGPAWGDGGTLRVMEPSGTFVVGVFSTPEPLRVAPADLSVLVLERTGGNPVLDASVSMEVRPPAGSGWKPPGVGRRTSSSMPRPSCLARPGTGRCT